MTQDSLVALPLPVLSALLCAVLAVLVRRLDLGNDRAPILFSLLFALFALEATLVAFRFGYGIKRLIFVQGILPLLVGPLMYLGFAALAVSPGRFRRLVLWHLGAVVAVVLGAQLLPMRMVPLDWAISGSYLFYAAALFLMWRKGPDHLVLARLDVSRSAAQWMLWGVGLLTVLLVLDSAISISFAMQEGGRASALISYGSILLIVFLLAVFFVLPPFLTARPAKVKPPSGADANAAQLEGAARDLLEGTGLYLDPDLTIQRLAKRLHVPVRGLSAAINESQGMNVSQYVNGFRLSHAADLLCRSDESIATVMAQSGFLTRSNFYREFQRVYGQSPAVYRQRRSATKDVP